MIYDDLPIKNGSLRYIYLYEPSRSPKATPSCVRFAGPHVRHRGRQDAQPPTTHLLELHRESWGFDDVSCGKKTIVIK